MTQASDAGDHTCSPQRKLWVWIQTSGKARIAGDRRSINPDRSLIAINPRSTANSSSS
ncbi:MAG TPA: hypothetical protein VG759_00395 [Candidatus Angelobacter sp.]|nr:hypothetical protein [Candidatus Angelobacter sp.]